MAITFPLAHPTSPGFQEVKFRGRTTVGRSDSEFTRLQRITEWEGERWEAEISLPPMTRQNAAAWCAWLLALRGGLGTFTLGPSGSAKTPRGVATGTPLINGSGQLGKTVNTKGWTAGVTGILKAGDFLSFGVSIERLFMNLIDANSDGSGNATLEIFPRLKEATTDNDPITAVSPGGLFRLDQNEAEWTIDSAQFYGIEFKALEAV